MATNKKSFLLYCDLIHTFEELTDEEAGKLIKHTLRYVNDLNPEAPDRLTKISFEPIKQALKRDLIKYEHIREKKRLAGLASAESKKQNQHVLTDVESVQHKPTESTVNDIDIVIDSVTVIKKGRKKKNIEYPSNDEVINYFNEKGYSTDAAIKFYDFYSCADWNDSKGNKVQSWKQKAQKIWFTPENKKRDFPETVQSDIFSHQQTNGLIDLSKIYNK